MGILSRLFSKESRASVGDPATAPHWGLFGFNPSDAGKNVTPETASSHATVYACVKLISETIASLPLFVFKRTLSTGERREATSHELWPIFRYSPNTATDPFTYWEMVNSHILLHGNAYDYIETAGDGTILGLWPLNPQLMEPQVVEVGTGQQVIVGYIYKSIGHGNIPLRVDEVFHRKDWTTNGAIGISRIQLLANTVGGGLATDEYANKYFKNSAMPTGILKTGAKLKEDLRTRLIKSWEDVHAGSSNAGKTALLEGGIEWESISISPEDSQLLQTRQWQTADIARIFRVPTIMIGGAGDADKSNTFASSEQQTLNFVTHTVAPWAGRLESQMNHKFFSIKDRRSLFIEFNLDGLLRGDIKTRFETYKMGREWGVFSSNDVRKLENMKPIENGNEYTRPMNMELVGSSLEEDGEAVDPMTALNGAQVTALLETVTLVTQGMLPKQSAIEIIVASFPVDRAQAEAILADVEENSAQQEQTQIEEPMEEPQADDDPTEE